MKLGGERYEIGARIITMRASAEYFDKAMPGTVADSAGDGTYHIQFENGRRHWLHSDEFKRAPARRRRVSRLEQLASAFAILWRGMRR